MSNMTDCGGGASGGGISTISNTSNSNGSSSSQQPPQPPPSKKKRNLPGNPDPTSEVIALSPNTLMTTNRFVCEICNKGFQRDQNLQLHRRGHNLPWKLKQRNSNDLIRKKVYICPESSCVHHNPSRALGDLTGIKKHFCRKHGEKRWKCEKCSKKYAVQSDWKAHAKTCGTKEYKCDCGTIFSRRDSFITHRAFCDALAEENNKANSLIHQPPHIITQIHLNNNQYELNINNINNSDPKINTLPLNMNMMNSFNNGSASMSATALLLKASQMGSTTATGSISTMAPSSFGPMYDQIGHFFNGTDLGTVRSNGENQSRGDDESTTMVDFLGINRGNLQQQDQMDQFVAGNLQGMNHFHEALGNLCHTRFN
jgi:hypothetical protein